MRLPKAAAGKRWRWHRPSTRYLLSQGNQLIYKAELTRSTTRRTSCCHSPFPLQALPQVCHVPSASSSVASPSFSFPSPTAAGSLPTAASVPCPFFQAVDPTTPFQTLPSHPAPRLSLQHIREPLPTYYSPPSVSLRPCSRRTSPWVLVGR